MKNILLVLILFSGSFLSFPAHAADRVIKIAMIAFDTPFLAACRGLRDGMAAQGYEEGRNIIFYEYNIAKDKSQIPSIMAKLAAEKVDLVFTVTTPVVLHVRPEAEKYHIPVIFTVVADPVGAGIVSSLRRPGAVTGISHIAFELVPKRLLLFKEAFPELKKVAVFYDPGQKGLSRNRNNPELQAAAREAGVKIIEYHIRNREDMEKACAEISRKTVDGLFMLPDAMSAALFGRMVELSRREKLPIMVIDNMMLAKGGVMGYSPDFYDVGLQAAGMVKSVLSGIDPGELPVQNPDQVKLIISIKEVNRLGLAVSPDFLIQADEFIR